MRLTITKYIFVNYYHLLNKEEISELDKFSRVSNFNYLKNNVIDAKELQTLRSIYKISEQLVQNYCDDRVCEYKTKIARQILKDNRSKIVFNRCPICSHLARTINAKQAPCGHRW